MSEEHVPIRAIYEPVPRELSKPYFVFAAPAWTPASAGVRAMHLLCHMVRQLGHDAYLVPTVKNPHLDTPLWKDHKASDRIIAVYPEGIQGNPLGAKVVARWLLFHQMHQFVSKTDLFFSWNPKYDRVEFKCVPLRISVVDEDIFKPPSFWPERTLKCFYARKYKHRGGKIPQEILDTHIDLDSVQPGDRQTLRDIFYQSQYVAIFEETTISNEAMLCGCPTVCCYSDFWPVHGWPSDNGLAFDFEPESIERANQTLIKRIGDYMRMKKEFALQVERFAEMCLARYPE